MSSAPATAALVAAATHVSDGVPATGAAVARTLLDTVGVALAARDEPAVRILLAHLAAEEPTPGPGVFWGVGQHGSRSQAALVNGLAAHALDWDDASPTAVMHPSAVLFPTALALVDHTTTVTDLVDAIDAGNATFRGISQVLDVGRHQDAGWHNTATTGRLAATVCAARLRRLDAGTADKAIGVAASSMGGSLANFGTMTKPLHAGLAAHDAVRAALLAERGFAAQRGQLDHPKGFFAAFPPASGMTPADLADAIAGWRTAWPEDVAVKRYPSCYGTHRAIDAALQLRPLLLTGDADPDIRMLAEQVEGVDVYVHPGARRPLIAHLPTSGLEGKFSLEYTVVRALLSGNVRLADFTDARVASAAPLTAKVRLVETDDPPATTGHVAPEEGGPANIGAGGPARYAVVRIRRAGAPELIARVDITRGDARNPLDENGLVGKFVAAVGDGSAAGTSAAGDLARRLLDLATRGPVCRIPALLDTADLLRDIEFDHTTTHERQEMRQ